MSTTIQAPPAAPRFPFGFRVWIERYAGLLHADESHDAQPDILFRPVECRIDSVRLVADREDEWDDAADCYRTAMTYPKGWEYEVVSESGSVWGWVTEAELIEKGYQVPA